MKKEAPLSDYIKLLEDADLIAENTFPGEMKDTAVTYVTYDSRKVVPGTLFICKGAHFKPAFLKSARDAGAVGYVSDEVFSEIEGMPYVLVGNLRRAMALIGNFYYDSVWKNLKLTGITGTKGKSTTAYYVKAILDEYLADSGKKESAVLSSIDNYDGVIREESHLTTPETLDLYEHYQNAVDSGIEYLTMEVSSQALKYARTYGITFDIGCFLDVGEDHISPVEHPSLGDYIASKMILMEQCRTAVINADDDHAEIAAKHADGHAEKIVTYGINAAADIQGDDIMPHRDGIDFRVRCSDFDEAFHIGMTGIFNVSNALAAIAITRELGVPVGYMKEGLEKARVSGRMEVFSNPAGNVIAIVDYAHNAMSFRALFESVEQEYPGRRAIIVFGCPGGKAQRRRTELGHLAGKFCDLCILTEEDCGEEDVVDICREIAGHVDEVGGRWEIEPDRDRAIRRAVELADENTVILLTAKGRETRMKRGTEYVETPSDVDIVTKYLKDK